MPKYQQKPYDYYSLPGTEFARYDMHVMAVA